MNLNNNYIFQNFGSSHLHAIHSSYQELKNLEI